MTGLDCLRNELTARGFSKAQVDSKVVAGVLDILSESGTVYTELYEAQKELSLVKASTAAEMSNYRREIESTQHNLAVMVSYINNFKEEIKKCETPEARDKMRIAQLFVNSVDVETPQNKTAFIVGLASILADGKIGMLESLQKIAVTPEMLRDAGENSFRKAGRRL